MVSRTINNIIDAPQDGYDVLVVVDVSGDREAVAETVEEELGGIVTERLPFDGLQIRVAETELATLEKLDAVERVSIDREIELAEGN